MRILPVGPKKRASPLAKRVSVTTAARLRKRKRRDDNTRPQDALLSFLWNAATRAACGSYTHATHAVECKRPHNAICGALNSRDCACGAAFAADVDLYMLTSYVRLMHAPSTPCYGEASAEHQWQLSYEIQAACTHAAPADASYALARFAALATITGRPSVLTVACRLVTHMNEQCACTSCRTCWQLKSCVSWWPSAWRAQERGPPSSTGRFFAASRSAAVSPGA